MRIEQSGTTRPPNPGYPSQNDIDVILPCPATCGGRDLRPRWDFVQPRVRRQGPERGSLERRHHRHATNANALGISPGTLARISLERFDEDVQVWQNVATSFVQAGSPDAYLQSGQVVTANDPNPGRWRVRVTNASGTGLVRVKVDFNPVERGGDARGRRPFSVSSTDFFTDLNKYIPDAGEQAEAVTVQEIAADPSRLDAFDSLVVVNTIGSRQFLLDRLGLSATQADAYFAGAAQVRREGRQPRAHRRSARRARADGSRPRRRGAQRAREHHLARAGRVVQLQRSRSGRRVQHRPAHGRRVSPRNGRGSSRVAVEPTPLGYPPDGTLDNAAAARMKQWWVRRTAWETGCGKANSAQCTSAIMLGGGESGLGERQLGKGVVRIIGAMFPDPSFTPGGPRDMRFGLQSYALSFSAWQVFLNLVDYQRPLQPDLSVGGITTASKVQDGRTALITATIANDGTGDAGATTTEFVLDGLAALGSVATPVIPAGGSVQVSVNWNTGGVKGDHTIRVTADSARVLDEQNATNNAGVLTVNVKANKVSNGSFEQASSNGTGPEGWTASSTAAGETSWSQDGDQGSKGVSIKGTGRNAALSGTPSWTSAPIAVVPGEVLDLVVSVRAAQISSAPAVNLVYLGPAGLILDTVKTLTAPLSTDGFVTLERAVTIPAGVASVRVVLAGFSSTDTRTAGTVTFDQVGLYAR